MSTVFEWKRFWGPRGEPIDLSDEGILYDPESEYGKFLTPNLVTLDQLADKPCLVLLGELGIGKSWALRAEETRSSLSAAKDGATSIWLNLRSFGSEDRLWKDLFETEKFIHWRKGDYFLDLFLDSLDECLLRVDNVATLIADQLPKEPVSRLRLRIACRTAPWPPILENTLIDLFGKDGFKAYELAPLRRRDVQHALEKSGATDVGAFFKSVETLGVSSFAIKPVSLNFLIKTYLRDGSLPANQIDLYERGCRILCEESNESRTASHRRGILDVNHRLVIASRIAAVTQFCNRFAVGTETEAVALPEDVSVIDLSGTEQIDGAPFAVSTDAIREVLDTGLFSSLGLGRSCWAHQTYSEFLAARYCVTHEMPAKQIQTFLFHPEGGGQRLVPQLYDAAAWLSVMNPSLLEVVADADPEALLGAAGASLSDAQRRLIVQSFLDQSERGRLLNLRPNLYWAYPKLGHPTLDVQLRPYLTDSRRKQNTRELAVDIARACKVSALGAELADLSLDPSQPSALRIPAGATAADIGTPEIKARLRPFAFGQAGEDLDDELKGIGLTAMWPGLITATDLFPLLTRPKNSQLHGAYSSFLYQLAPTFRAEDLPAALDWFTGQPQRDMGPIDALMDDVIRMAVKNMSAPGVLGGLVKAVLSRVKLHDQLMSGHDHGQLKEDLSDDNRRQMLLGELLPWISESEIFFLDHAGVRMVPASDLPWLLQRLEAAEPGASAQMEAKLIRRLVDTSDPDQMRQLWLACQNHPALNTECKYLFFVPLDSEEVRTLRESSQHQRKREEKLLDPPPQARVESDLANFEQGNLSAWVQLTWDLSLKPTSTHYEGHDNPDLTVSAGWQSSSDEVKRRIQSAALGYVNDGEPENDKWFCTQEIYYSAIGGLQALGLLRNTAGAKLGGVPNAAWKKWVPIILRYHYGGAGELKLSLLRDAYSRIPDDVIGYLVQTIDSANDQFGSLLIAPELEACWDNRLASALLAKLREQHLKPAVVGSLLQMIVEHGTTGSSDAAKSLIRVPPSELDRERSLMTSTIEALISGAKDAGWSDVWPVIRDYPQFGRSVIESLSYKHGGTGNWVTKLTEEQIGEFYTWMIVNYPPSASDHRVAGAVGPSQTVVMLRDHTLQILKGRGTFAASEAIRKVMERLPHYSWLGLYLEEAESLARAATWQPIAPLQLLTLASNRQKRLIENTQQLTSVILESLDRLQTKLKGELPAANDLWNADHNQYWPKDEEDFSNYVTRHLDEDIQHRGVVVNREVQIRRGVGGGTGQFTDIHVDAVVPGAKQGTYARLYLIIEAKGNWNKELFTNMETQLRDRYLKDNRCRIGIYLVGWFSSPKWKDDDARKKQYPYTTITDARNRPARQALELSQDGFEIRSYVLDIPLT